MSKAKALWQSLIVANPMLAEISRFRKRFLTFRGGSTAINGGLGVILALFAFFCIFCCYTRGDMQPTPLLFIYLVAEMFAIPFLLHGTIASERERRSWDMLMVAPISHAQIIAGKFIAAVLGILLTFGIFLIPVGISEIFYEGTHWTKLLLGIIVVASQACVISALTILISARVKRPMIALAVSLGAVLIIQFIAPSFVALADSFTGRFINESISPFSILAKLSVDRPYDSINSYSSEYASTLATLTFSTLTHLAMNLVVTIAMLTWATKTLIFADNEVRFLPKKKVNARS